MNCMHNWLVRRTTFVIVLGVIVLYTPTLTFASPTPPRRLLRKPKKINIKQKEG